VPSTHLKDMTPADPQPAPSVPDTTYTMPAQTVTKAVTKVAVADYAALAPDELRCECVCVCVRARARVCLCRPKSQEACLCAQARYSWKLTGIV